VGALTLNEHTSGAWTMETKHYQTRYGIIEMKSGSLYLVDSVPLPAVRSIPHGLRTELYDQSVIGLNAQP
jgi:hypothetical protein